MNMTLAAGFVDTRRADARACAQAGIAALTRAFKQCGRDDVAHRYSDAVQSRFHALTVELLRIVEHGTIRESPAYALHLKARAARSTAVGYDLEQFKT